MQRAAIASETIVSIGYAAATSILEIELSSGEVMQYYHVPLSVYIAFAKASSKGDYYHHNIKSLYESKQVVQDVTDNKSDNASNPVNN